MKRITDTVEILHVSEAPQLRVSATEPADVGGLHVLEFSGTMCTMTVPGAAEAIDDWLDRTELTQVGADLRRIDFIDGRGVSLLVVVQRRLRELGIAWSIIDANERVRELLEVCDLLEPMGIQAVSH